MSAFTKDPVQLQLREDLITGRPLTRNGRCTWILLHSVTYDVGTEGSGVTVTAPVGLITDLASIPWPARGLLPPDGPWVKAALIHDYMYFVSGYAAERLPGGIYQGLERKDADDILKEAMEVLGVPAWKREVIYRAVRLFGGRGWGS